MAFHIRNRETKRLARELTRAEDAETSADLLAAAVSPIAVLTTPTR